MRYLTVAALVIGALSLLASDGLSQEAAVATAAKGPLQIVDECVQAIQKGDFASYVDHLSKDEQRAQAGYALLVSSTFLPTVDAGPEQIEPEMLLLLRAFGDLIKEHTADQPVRSGYYPAGPVAHHPLVQSPPAYTNQQAVSAPRVREILMTSAATLKDPRLFLIDALTEFSRPVQVAGAEPEKHAHLPVLAELAKEYQRQEWTLYTRGEYAIAVPKKRETVTRSPVDGPQPPVSRTEQVSPLRIEFQKIDGVWRISHILPHSVLPTVNAVKCTGPECNLTTYGAPSGRTSYSPSTSAQSSSQEHVRLPASPGR